MPQIANDSSVLSRFQQAEQSRNGKFWKFLTPVIVAIVLFNFCIPGRPSPWLAWIAFAPLFLQLQQTTSKRGFLIAGLHGWLLWLSGVWWLYSPLHDILDLTISAALIMILLGTLFFAFPYAIAGALIARRRNSPTILNAAQNAAILTLSLTFLTPIFSGNIAHTQYRYPIVLQIVELGGAPLLLFSILLVNGLVANSFSAFLKSEKPWTPLLAACAIVLAITSYGMIRLRQLDAEMKSAPRSQWFTVGAIQPNIPIKVAPERQPIKTAATNDFYSAFAQARDLVKEHPDVDVLAFPENPETFQFNSDSSRRQALGALISQLRKPAMLNVDAIDTQNPQSGIAERYNVAIYLNSNRDLVSSYAKIKRLPLVEYLPGEKQFPALRKFFPKSQRVLAGAGPVTFDAAPGVKIIPLICYEGTITSLALDFVAKGGNFIINQVNDSWFLRTPASETHLALTLFRSVEFRVPIVRVTNSGIGAHIEATGRVIEGSRTELFTATATAFPLYIPATRSIYAIVGNWWMLIFIVLFIPTLRRNYR